MVTIMRIIVDISLMEHISVVVDSDHGLKDELVLLLSSIDNTNP